MATYPILPATLAAMAATVTDPQGTEDAGKIDDAIRQTRNWAYDMFGLIFDSTTMKPKSSFFNGGSLPAGLIRGTNPTDLSTNGQREILQGSVQYLDIATDGVRTTNIQDGAVTSSKLANEAIAGTKLQTGTVPGTALQDGAVTSGKLATGAVTGNAISNNGIQSGKFAVGAIRADDIGVNQVSGDKLPVASAGQILVGGNGANANEFAARTLSGALKVDAQGVVSLLSGVGISIARIVEAAGKNVPGGSSVAVTTNYNIRGVAVPWRLVQDNTNGAFDVDRGEGAGYIWVKQSGFYLFICSAPAYKSGATSQHRLAAQCFFDGNDVSSAATANHWGTTEQLNSSSSRSWLFFLQEFMNVSDVRPGSLKLFHYIESAQATNGLGVPSNFNNQQEFYSEVWAIRLGA